MALASGTKLGSYEVIAQIGAGGMGEVYQAHDTKLGRDVAIKVLPEALEHNADRLSRLQREAKLLAALNHPNIATIYGLEESNGTHYLMMELVSGETLAERIKREGAVPIEEALAIAKQIAEAIEGAHEKAIIHRDLKPANVKVTPEGKVKVLDFGLAKAFEGDSEMSDPSNSPTLSQAATMQGVILGTAAYMSPEQAKGKAVDKRTDIWAFGCVLYELLTGKQAFHGEDVTDILAAVVRAEPGWQALPAATPVKICDLLRRCLQKDKMLRMRDAGDARIEIAEALAAPATTDTAVEAPARGLNALGRRPLIFGLGALLLGAAVATLATWVLKPAPEPSMHFSAVTNFAGVQADPTISPDGRSVAFASNRDGQYNIYVGLVRGGNLVQITHDPNLESGPRWSPDGTTIAYARLNDSGLWDIWDVPTLGGTPHRVILNAMDPDWSPDGHSLAYANMADGAIWISGVSGENAHEAVPVQAMPRDSEPRFSPDGRQLAFTTQAAGPFGELEVADLASGKVRQLTHDGALALSPAWSPDGRSIYFASSRGGTMNIWKIAASGGDPQQFTDGQGDDAGLDVSKDGKRIVFSTWRENINIAQLDIMAKPGDQIEKLVTTDPARNQLAPVYSPDGRHLAYFSNLKGIEKEGIWVANADGSDPLQLVQDSRINTFPQWTFDNQRLIYWSAPSSVSGTGIEYRSVSITGGAPQAVQVFKEEPDLNFDIGPDGRLLFQGPKSQVQAFDPRNNKTETLAALPSTEKCWLLRWSPDGHSVAYVVRASREDDPNAGLWVDDFKNPPRQIFRGWVAWYARRPANEIHLLEGKADLNGVLWKVGWDGQNPSRIPISIRLDNSYWVKEGRNAVDTFDVAPDGRHLAVQTQEVLGANIGMIDNVR